MAYFPLSFRRAFLLSAGDSLEISSRDSPQNRLFAGVKRFPGGRVDWVSTFPLLRALNDSELASSGNGHEFFAANK